MALKTLSISEAQIDQCRKENESQKQNYGKLVAHYNERFLSDQKKFTAKVPMYKELNELETEEKKSAVELKIMQEKLKQAKKIRKQRNEIRKKIYNADIVQFARAFLNCKSLSEMSVAIKTEEKLRSELLTQYNTQKFSEAKKEVGETNSKSLLYENEGSEVSLHLF